MQKPRQTAGVFIYMYAISYLAESVVAGCGVVGAAGAGTVCCCGAVGLRLMFMVPG